MCRSIVTEGDIAWFDIFLWPADVYPTTAPTPPPSASRGGRPIEYDWVGAGIHAGARIYTDGLPEEKRGDVAKVVGWINDWFMTQPCGKPKSDTKTKEFAARLLAEYRRLVGN
jgi:hypothetical protein